MTEPKTRSRHGTVTDFLKTIDNSEKRADCRKVAAMMRAATGARPRMWGTSIVGYDRYEYHYASGRSGEWFLCGYSPRKRDLTIYIMPGFEPFKPLMAKLGKYKTGKSCLYLRRLADVDEKVLQALIAESVKEMRKRYP